MLFSTETQLLSVFTYSSSSYNFSQNKGFFLPFILLLCLLGRWFQITSAPKVKQLSNSYPTQDECCVFFRLFFSSVLLQLCFFIASPLTRFPAGPHSLLTWSCWRMTCPNRNRWLSALGQQVWGSHNLAVSLSELMCLACHCFFPVPLVTAGLVLSCVLIRWRVSHTPWGVAVSWHQPIAEMIWNNTPSVLFIFNNFKIERKFLNSASSPLVWVKIKGKNTSKQLAAISAIITRTVTLGLVAKYVLGRSVCFCGCCSVPFCCWFLDRLFIESLGIGLIVQDGSTMAVKQKFFLSGHKLDYDSIEPHDYKCYHRYVDQSLF